MKKSIFVLSTLFLFSCNNAENKKETKQSTTEETVSSTIPDSATVTKAWMEYSTPNENHKRMSADIGIWEEEITSWQNANAQPYKNKMKAEITTLYNGLYQEAKHTGEFAGMKFEGRSTLAYDNASKEYISTWIDNMGSGILVMKGQYNEKTKTYNMKGECVDPVTKKINNKREVFTIIDEKNQKMEMFDTGYDGKEFKSMEIKLKRIK